MGSDQTRLSADERINLIAYLDGELGEAEARTIALKVSKDPMVRHEVEALQAAWGLLDFLPQVKASEFLSSKTMTAVSELAAPEPTAPIGGFGFELVNHRPRRLLVMAMTAVLAATSGFVITRWAWADPNARLIRRLSLAEHLDEYRDVESFDFLQLLDESPEFDDAE